MDICNLLMKQFKYEIDFSTNISMQRLDQYIASWPLRFCKAIHYLKQHPNSIYSIHLPNRDGKLTLSLSKKGKLIIHIKKAKSLFLKDQFKILLKKVDEEIKEEEKIDYEIKKTFSREFLEIISKNKIDLLIKDL